MVRVFLQVLSISLFQYHIYGTDQSPVARLSNGDILEGFHHVTETGAHARIFLGVPYAQPPLGPLRFKKPVARFRNGTPSRISCLNYGPSCWQNHTHNGRPLSNLSEDCLYVNIFAGVDCERCPVIYYIHGGSYEFDSPAIFPTDVIVENFANRSVVFITVAYRLSVLGFWSTGDDEAAGNYGLHDTIQGLKWVQREIRSFGGDPNRVSIMGHSSGAVMVSFLTLTPLAEGLFQSAIMMSISKPILSNDLSKYHRLAVDVGCANAGDDERGEDESSVVDCMRTIPPDILINLHANYEDETGSSLSLRTLPRYDGPGGFFPRPVEELMQNRRRIDLMIGTTSNEAGYDRLAYLNATAESVSQTCESLVRGQSVLRNEKMLTRNCQRLYVDNVLNGSFHDSYTSTIHDSYTSTNATDQDQQSNFSIWTEQAAKLESDTFFIAPTFREAATVSRAGGNVFLYSFDYVKQGLEAVAPWHAFDLTFVMGEGTYPFSFDDRDIAIKSIYVPLFVNFATYGDPTPQRTHGTPKAQVWTPLDSPPISMNYYHIDLPAPSMRDGYHYEAVLFWDYIVPVLGGLQESLYTTRINSSLRSLSTNTVKDISGSDWKMGLLIAISAFLLISVSVGSVFWILLQWPQFTLRFLRRSEGDRVPLIPINDSGGYYSTFQ